MINRLYNGLWYIVGGSVLLLAVLVTIARLLLPWIDHYREEIERWAGAYMGAPVSIESVAAQWHGWNPELTLHGVVLRERDTGEALASFDSASIKFSSLASLARREPVPAGLIVSGARLELRRTADGAFRLGDAGLTRSDNDEHGDSWLSSWILHQPYLRLRNTELVWIDEMHSRPPVHLSNANLQLGSHGAQTQISGSARLSERHGESVDFAIDAHGDLTGGQWSAEIYLDARGIRPAAWPQYSRWRDLEFRAGRVNLTVWSQWQDATLRDAEGTITADDVLVRNSNGSNLIRRFDGRIDYVRQSDNRWSLAVAIDELGTWNGDWPVTHLRLSGQQARQVSGGYISHVLLQDLAPFLGAMESSATQKFVLQSARGEISNLHFRLDPEAARWQASGRLKNLVVDRDYGEALFSNLNGVFAVGPHGGHFRFEPGSIRLSDNDIFVEPINSLDVDGLLTWRNLEHPSRLQLRTDDLTLATTDHTLRLNGMLEFDNQGLPEVDMAAALSGGDATALQRFIPATAGDKFKTRARRAIVEGRLDQAALVVRGDLDDFPFRKHEGQFKLHAWFSGLTLDYHEEWPTLYALDGELIVDRYRLEARVPHARTYNAVVRNVDAHIADLFVEKHVLHMTCEATGSAEDAVSFLRDSPLDEKEESIRRMLELEYGGDIALQLDMAIKLYPGEDDISGRVELLGNTVTAPQLDIHLTEVRGLVTFSETRLESENITGKYARRDVEVELEREGDAETEPTMIRITGTADADLITELISKNAGPENVNDAELAKILQGASRWQFEYVVAPTADAEEIIRLSSDLNGLVLALPPPLGKERGETRPLEIRLSVPPAGQTGHRAWLAYDGALSAVYASGQFAVRLGSDVMPDPSTANNLITGSLPRLDLDQWISFIVDSDLIAIDAAESRYQWLPGIDLFVDELALREQVFPRTRLMLDHGDDTVTLTLEGSEANGRIRLAGSGPAAVLTAEFRTLKLTKVKDDDPDPQSLLDPRDLPALNINIASLAYNQADFGTFRLEAEKIPEGLNIRSFSISRPAVEISGQGSWKAVSNEIFSQFDIELNADRFDDMLAMFGYSKEEEAVGGGKTHIRIDALWPGSPMDFNLARLDGALQLEIGKGRFLDIDPKAARLLGLLSVSALPRRLLLDFSDIFQEGFAFDRIQGSFNIQDGQAFTSDLRMEGPAALITATGRTGLVDQTYDQVITVIPQVSNTLPVAGALFGPAGIGIGAAIFLAGKLFEGIPQQIDRMLGYRYALKGTWENPVIEPVRPPAQTEKSPAQTMPSP